MSSTTADWLPFFLFAALFVGFIATEILWLSKKQWTSAGKATAFSLITNISSFGVGTLLVTILGTVAFMLIMGPQGRGGDTPESVFIAIIIAALIVPPVIFIFFKRLMLRVLSIGSGRSAWTYSIATSMLFLLTVIVPPSALFYLMVSPPWK